MAIENVGGPIVARAGWILASLLRIPAIVLAKSDGTELGTAAAPLYTAPGTAASTAVLTDRSGTVTTGGTAQVLMAANASRRGFSVQNNSSGALTISTVGTASTTAGFILQPGQMYEAPAGGVALTAISILGATTGQRFDAREW